MSSKYDGIFPHFMEAVNHHFKKASTILDGNPHRLMLAKILVHGEHIPYEK